MASSSHRARVNPGGIPAGPRLSAASAENVAEIRSRQRATSSYVAASDVQLLSMFHQMDTDANGVLSVSEITQALQTDAEFARLTGVSRDGKAISPIARHSSNTHRAGGDAASIRMYANTAAHRAGASERAWRNCRRAIAHRV